MICSAKRKVYGRRRSSAAPSAVQELRARKGFVKVPWAFLADLWRLFPEAPGPMIALHIFAESTSYRRRWAPARGTMYWASLGNVDQQSIRYTFADLLKRQLFAEDTDQAGSYRTTWKPGEEDGPWRAADDYERRRPVRSAGRDEDEDEDEEEELAEESGQEERPIARSGDSGTRVRQLVAPMTYDCGAEKKNPIKPELVRSVTVRMKASGGGSVSVDGGGGDLTITVGDRARVGPAVQPNANREIPRPVESTTSASESKAGIGYAFSSPEGETIQRELEAHSKNRQGQGEPPNPGAGHKLWLECREKAPECSAGDVAEVIRDFADSAKTTNKPVAFLIRAVLGKIANQVERRRLQQGAVTPDGRCTRHGYRLPCTVSGCPGGKLTVRDAARIHGAGI